MRRTLTKLERLGSDDPRPETRIQPMLLSSMGAETNRDKTGPMIYGTTRIAHIFIPFVSPQRANEAARDSPNSNGNCILISHFPISPTTYYFWAGAHNIRRRGAYRLFCVCSNDTPRRGDNDGLNFCFELA